MLCHEISHAKNCFVAAWCCMVQASSRAESQLTQLLLWNGVTGECRGALLASTVATQGPLGVGKRCAIAQWDSVWQAVSKQLLLQEAHGAAQVNEPRLQEVAGKLVPEWWRILHTGTQPLQICLLPLQHLCGSTCTGHSSLQQLSPSLAVTAAHVSCPCHRLSTSTPLPLQPPLHGQVPHRLMLATPSPVPCYCTAKSYMLGLEELGKGKLLHFSFFPWSSVRSRGTLAFSVLFLISMQCLFLFWVVLMLLPPPTFLIFLFKCGPEFSTQSVWPPIVLVQHWDESLLYLLSTG